MKNVIHNEEVFDSIMNAMRQIDGDLPLIEVLEGLATVVAISAKDAEISPASLVSCFALTVDRVYAEEPEEFNLEDYRHLHCVKCGKNDQWIDDDIVNIENGEVWCNHCGCNTVVVEKKNLQ